MARPIADLREDNFIPFYFPLLGELVWFNHQLFNDKFANFKQHNDPKFRNFVVLTVAEANAVLNLLQATHEVDF